MAREARVVTLLLARLAAVAALALAHLPIRVTGAIGAAVIWPSLEGGGICGDGITGLDTATIF